MVVVFYMVVGAEFILLLRVVVCLGFGSTNSPSSFFSAGFQRVFLFLARVLLACYHRA